MLRYHLDDLGWWQFEELCQAILKAQLGSTVLSWGGQSDRGRDAYCDNDVTLPGTRTLPGPAIFQVKFVEGANAAGAKPHALLMAAVKAEVNNIAHRIQHKKWVTPNLYVFITNVRLTASLRASIEEQFAEVGPGCRVIEWGGADICDMLDGSPKLRTAFPQILGLRDLQELLTAICNKTTLERSKPQLEKASSLASVFVPTKSYHHALQALNTHSFVVLTGPPEVGKTTVALMIGLTKTIEGWSFIDCVHPDDFFSTVDPERPQVFVVDDAFGSTEYRPDLAAPWGDQMERVLRRVDSQHWLIWTTRPAPLHAALASMHLQGRAENFPSPAGVEVDGSQLTTHERVQILYRHAKNAQLKPCDKELIRRHALDIVRNPHFTPERIRVLVDQVLPGIDAGDRNIASVNRRISRELARPTDRMQRAFDALKPDHQLFLRSLLDAGPRYITAEAAEAAFERHREPSMTEPLSRIVALLDRQFISANDRSIAGRVVGTTYGWVHASWRDLMISDLIRNRVARRRFLSVCGIDGAFLALSGSGGAAGEISFPFAQDREDWRLITEALVRVLKNDDLEMTRRVLDVLHYAESRFAADPSRAQFSDCMNKLLQRCCAACLELWRETTRPLSMDLLAAFYRLSVRVRPLPPSPPLDHTWEECWSNLNRLLKKHPQPLDEIITQAQNAIKLVSLIRANEPRFLRQVDYPNAHSTECSRILDAVAARVSPQSEDDDAPEADIEEGSAPPDRDNLESWIADCDARARLLQSCAAEFPGLRERAQAIEKSVRLARTRFWDECTSLAATDDDRDDDDAYDRYKDEAAGAEIDIMARIFEDL